MQFPSIKKDARGVRGLQCGSTLAPLCRVGSVGFPCSAASGLGDVRGRPAGPRPTGISHLYLVSWFGI